VKENKPTGPRSRWIDAGHLLGKGVGLIFTDRSGGCSPPPFDTLNLSYRAGDDNANVAKNRGVVAAELGIEPERFIYLKQAHGVGVRQACSSDLGSPGSQSYEAFVDTDGVYTVIKLVPLAVLTADCIPLALAAASQGVVAMLHAGWKGTIHDIVAGAISRIRMEFSIEPRGLHAVMGPGIAPCCYRVDEGRARVFVEKYGERSGVVLLQEGFRLDLFQANRINLLEAGLSKENIYRVGGCTCCEKDYFSYRREGRTGRQGAFIFLR
jgi:YfiH family protein